MTEEEKGNDKKQEEGQREKEGNTLCHAFQEDQRPPQDPWKGLHPLAQSSIEEALQEAQGRAMDFEKKKNLKKEKGKFN